MRTQWKTDNTDEERAHVQVRFRAVLIGTLLIIPNNYWVIQMEKVRPGPYPTIISLFLNAILILLLLLIINKILYRFSPRTAFNRAELLLIYLMVCIGSAFAGHDMVPVLIQMAAHPYQFATDSNNWKTTMLPHLPAPLVVQDTEALKNYFVGNSSIYRWENLRAWLVPLGWWFVFCTLLWWVMLCLCTLVRKQWTEEEKLSYPLVELPLQMSRSKAHLWNNRLLWAGFAVAGGINLINGLHYLYPSLPEIPVKHEDLLPYLPNKPWNAVGWTPYSFYPYVVGIGYLLPVDLVFSCWFFYWFWKAQLVISNAMAWDTVPEFPFIREQGFGGYLAIGLYLLIGGRGFLQRLAAHLRRRSGDLSDEGEALSYRAASNGFLLGLAGLTLFLWAFGMSLLIALSALCIYLLISLVITRIRAELGPPVHDQHFSGPDHMLTRWFGTQGWNPSDLSTLNFFYWFNRAYRSHPMPFGLEGLKLAGASGASLKVYFWAMFWAGIVGTLAAYWAFLHCAYQYGTGAKFIQGYGFGTEAYNRLATWLQSPQKPNLQAQYATGIGFTTGWILMILRMRIYGFPFHPIGYAISGSWSMNLVWLPLLIAWGIKIGILRFGGLRLYRQGIPFFLGLVLGEAIVGLSWSLIGLIFNIPTYSFWGA